MKLVILDRDGTINEDRDDYVKSPEEWVPVPGALEAIARLNHNGWHTVVATNQSGIGRGLFDMATLNAMHAEDAPDAGQVHGGRIDAVFFCPHTSRKTGCDCRKPHAGAVPPDRRALRRRARAAVPVVGDTLRDLQAGVAAGCEPHLLRTGKAAPERMNDAQVAELVAPGCPARACMPASTRSPSG